MNYGTMSVDRLIDVLIGTVAPDYVWTNEYRGKVRDIESALRKAVVSEASVGTLTKTKRRKGQMEWKTNDNLNYHAGIYDVVPRGGK